MSSTQILMDLGDASRPAFRVRIDDGSESISEILISGTGGIAPDLMQAAVLAFANTLAVPLAKVRSIYAVIAAETQIDLSPPAP
ncbi:hypothetical protein ACFYXS_01310 [Streptomyces sp. NPDC002574]|uniref:hypothetical protein n=1 Tax=Streptomyces sp. NPDC002574 TaxID=3364652 RepID=UPI00368BD360